MIREHLSQYLNYWIVGIVSLIALCFLPMLGSVAGLALVLPTTVAGWLVYIGTKLVVAGINVVIFHCFFQQSKINVKDNPRVIEALKILDKYETKERSYISPSAYTRKAYISKGTLTFITSIIGAFSLTHALLVFDIVVFLTYLFTLIGGVIGGILNMKSAENYWINDQYFYAKHIEEIQQKEETEPNVSTQ